MGKLRKTHNVVFNFDLIIVQNNVNNGSVPDIDGTGIVSTHNEDRDAFLDRLMKPTKCLAQRQ